MERYLPRITELLPLCDSDERELIDTMLSDCAEYVLAVSKHIRAKNNYLGREQDAYRSAVSEADSSRTIFHNSLISSVDIVNRIFALHDFPPIYTGGPVRRNYGDFALALVSELFEAR